MDDNLLVKFIFIFVLIILGLVIGLIIILLPRTNVQLDQSCTHQSDCAVGLVCSKAPRSLTGTVCLKGLNLECETNSECSTGLVCRDKVCLLPTGTIALTIENNLSFNNNISQPEVAQLQFNQNNFVNKMTPITTLPTNFFSNNFNLVDYNKKKH